MMPQFLDPDMSVSVKVTEFLPSIATASELVAFMVAPVTVIVPAE